MNKDTIRTMLSANGEERVVVKKHSNQIEKQLYPILEYDSSKSSITKVKTDIYPQRTKIKRCLITYFQDVVVKMETSYKIFQAFKLRIEGKRPEVYQLNTPNESIYVHHKLHAC